MVAKVTKNKPRKGLIKDRTQFLNPLTKRFTKRDSKTGRIMNVKEDGKAFKRVTKEGR